MTLTDDLVPVLKKLRLSGVLQTLDLRIKEAVDADLGHTEFLFRLCADEVERREAKQLDQRMRRAAFDSAKRLEDFEWSFNPQIPKAKIVDLATCHFVAKQENVLLIGPTGVGKSHLAQAIGERACRAGHSVCYVSAHRMLSQLRAARADQSHDKRMLRSREQMWLPVEQYCRRGVAVAPQRRVSLAAPGLADQGGDLILDELVGGGRDGSSDGLEQALSDLPPQVQDLGHGGGVGRALHTRTTGLTAGLRLRRLLHGALLAVAEVLTTPVLPTG